MKDDNGWFKVKDRLPDMKPHSYYGEKSDSILLYTQVDNGCPYEIYIGYMVKGNIFYSDDFGKFKDGDVTHWQPLPHPPIK